MINITITTVRRREILKRTLDSFYTNLFYNNRTKIIINVDPIGDNEESMLSVDLCRKYTSNVEYRCPGKADFGKAFHWVWSQVKNAHWIFNLEDDWELLQKVDIRDMFEILNSNPRLALLRFSLWPSNDKTIQAWGKIPFIWNGQYFQCIRPRYAYCGHPTLIKRQWFYEMQPHVRAGLNPERQFRDPPNKAIIKRMPNWDYGLYQKPNQCEYIRDIGRRWRKENGWIKIKEPVVPGRWEWKKNENRGNRASC